MADVTGLGKTVYHRTSQNIPTSWYVLQGCKMCGVGYWLSYCISQRLSRAVNYKDERYSPPIPQIVYYQPGIGTENNFHSKYVDGEYMSGRDRRVWFVYLPSSVRLLIGATGRNLGLTRIQWIILLLDLTNCLYSCEGRRGLRVYRTVSALENSPHWVTFSLMLGQK